jgi:hypothetical protein
MNADGMKFESSCKSQRPGRDACCATPLLFWRRLVVLLVHERRRPVERKAQILAEAQQVSTLRVDDANPLPALTGPHQGCVHELQAAPRIEEPRDALGASVLFQDAPLDHIRGPRRLPVRAREAQRGETRLQIVPARSQGRRVETRKARRDRQRGLPSLLIGRRAVECDDRGLNLGPRRVGHPVQHIRPLGPPAAEPQACGPSLFDRTQQPRPPVAREAHRRAQAAADQVPQHPQPAAVALRGAPGQVPQDLPAIGEDRPGAQEALDTAPLEPEGLLDRVHEQVLDGKARQVAPGEGLGLLPQAHGDGTHHARADQAGPGDVGEGVLDVARRQPPRIHLGDQAVEDIGGAAQEAEEPGLGGYQGLPDLGELQRDVAFGRPHLGGLVAVSGPAMGFGAAVTDVAVPAQGVRSLFLEQLLRQPLSPHPEQGPHHVPVLRHAVVEQPRDLFPNLGARCYPGHGFGFPFLLRKELVSPAPIRGAQAVNFYRTSTTSPTDGNERQPHYAI